MRGSLKRSAVATVGLLVVAWAVLPMALAAAASKSDVGNGDEAWYVKNKEPLAESPTGDVTCDLPTGCNASGNAQRPSGPHPEGVLVVGANAGDDDAQTFFNFNLNKLPLGAVVTGGTVTMPVATDDEAGNFRAEDAKMVACMVTGFIPGGADGGSYQDRPEFDDGTCVPVELDDTAETPTYTFNLNRFGKEWGTGTPMQGVTVMVDPEVSPPAPQETWRVVFNSSRRASEDPETYPPITSDLQYKKQAGSLGGLGGGFDDNDDFDGTGGGVDDGGAAAGGGGFDDSGGGFDNGGTTGGTFDSGAAPADTGSISAPPQSAEPPAVDEQPQAADQGGEQPIAAPAEDAVPAAATGMSPAVWVLPLLAVAMAGALAWSLMQPVELVGEREGAVSKLMRNRRIAGSDTSNPA